MRTFAELLLKEEKAIFTSPIAYVVLSVFLVIMGYTFTLTLFVSHVPTLVHLFFQIYVLFLLTVPMITMRLVAEERRLRTIEVLLTAPVSEAAVIFAKYLASLSLVALMLVLSGAYAVTLGILGPPDWGPIWSGYLGLFLLGAALVAIGLMTSSLVSNQIIAALLSLSLFLLLWITFFLLAGGDLGMGSGWHTAGGWVGLITGIDALYLSFAEVTNATFGRPVIAVGGAVLKA